MKANIKLALGRISPLHVAALQRNVIAKLTDNPFFTTPVIPLEDMQVLADRLDAAIMEAIHGSRLSRIQRDNLLALAKVMLTAQADYVRAVSKGDPGKLVSSGFGLAKARQLYDVPLAPEKLTSRATNLAQEVKVRWPKSPGAVGYHVYMTDKEPQTEHSWTYIAFTAKGSFVFKGLESFKPYWFCVRAVGSVGESNMSSAILGRAM